MPVRDRQNAHIQRRMVWQPSQINSLFVGSHFLELPVGGGNKQADPRPGLGFSHILSEHEQFVAGRFDDEIQITLEQQGGDLQRLTADVDGGHPGFITSGQGHGYERFQLDIRLVIGNCDFALLVRIDEGQIQVLNSLQAAVFAEIGLRIQPIDGNGHFFDVAGDKPDLRRFIGPINPHGLRHQCPRRQPGNGIFGGRCHGSGHFAVIFERLFGVEEFFFVHLSDGVDRVLAPCVFGILVRQLLPAANGFLVVLLSEGNRPQRKENLRCPIVERMRRQKFVESRFGLGILFRHVQTHCLLIFGVNDQCLGLTPPGVCGKLFNKRSPTLDRFAETLLAEIHRSQKKDRLRPLGAFLGSGIGQEFREDFFRLVPVVAVRVSLSHLQIGGWHPPVLGKALQKLSQIVDPLAEVLIRVW